MKRITLLLVLMVTSFTQAQEKKLLLQSFKIEDWSTQPIYPKLVTESNGKKQWKKAFQHLDDIDVYGITYLSDGLKVKGLMVKPKKEGNYPCIIFNRGGNRNFGALRSYHGAMELGKIASQGYVVIASQYRGNGGSEGKEEFGGKDVNDVTILTDVLKEVEGADTDNIGMYGWSRGGMMTYLALTKTNRIKAAVVGGGLSNHYSSLSDRPGMEKSTYSQLIPEYETNKKAALDQRSAVKWADKFSKNVPVLLLHGNADWRVKTNQSLELAMEFEKYRVPYRLIVFEGGDHGITEHRTEVNQQILNWFDKYLKKNQALPNMEYHGR